jgi:hypothetical protein
MFLVISMMRGNVRFLSQQEIRNDAVFAGQALSGVVTFRERDCIVRF